MSRRLAEMAEDDRPRERLAALGPEALRDAELVALVLRSGRVGESGLALADGLIAEFGGLAGLASASAEALARRPGMGPAKAASLVAACHLAGRIASAEDRAPLLRSTVDVAEVAIPLLVHCRSERVVLLVVDRGDRLRRTLTLVEHAPDQEDTPVRDVLNLVLRHDGGGFALVRNHPDGDPAPTPEEQATASALAAAAATVGLGFLGQVIVAGRCWEATGAEAGSAEPD